MNPSSNVHTPIAIEVIGAPQTVHSQRYRASYAALQAVSVRFAIAFSVSSVGTQQRELPFAARRIFVHSRVQRFATLPRSR
jgi:hypothetical protein